MIVGTGIDIIEIARVERAAGKPSFMARLFTPSELETLKERNVESAAGAFAAKEAISKALGTGIDGMDWQDMEILHDERGRPFARLSGRAQARLEAVGGKRLHISISHSREYAVAQAIAEGD